jgi:hypothetical protein
MKYIVEVRRYWGGQYIWEGSLLRWDSRDMAQLYGALSSECQGETWRVMEWPDLPISNTPTE